jgi:hypothetical protein
MPDIFRWMGNNESMQASEFAQSMWNLIQRRPEALVIQRLGVNLDPQTVRVEYSKEARESTDRSSTANVRSRDIMVYGVKDHPDPGVPDTDISTGDLFSLNNRLFRVTDVYINPGQIEAEGVAIS